MEKTPATVGIEEVPVITISQEKYDRLIAAEARMEALGTMLRVVPEYFYNDVLNAFLGKLKSKDPIEPETPATEATPDA